VTGDDGLAGSLELRYGRSLGNAWFSSYQIYGFYDLGTVWNMAVSDAARRQSLASLGGGVRVTLMRGVTAAIELARPLTRTPAPEGNKAVRIFGSLSASF
jgi:hemolysin activation/secretion protein